MPLAAPPWTSCKSTGITPWDERGGQLSKYITDKSTASLEMSCLYQIYRVPQTASTREAHGSASRLQNTREA